MEIIRQEARDTNMSALRADSIIKSLSEKRLITLIVEICSKCNLACVFCDLHSGKLKNAENQKGIMEEGLYHKLIDDLSGLGYKLKVLHFHGMGEPLMQKRLPEMIRHAYDNQVAERYTLITNGTLMTPPVFDALLASGLDEIRVSLDTVEPEQYEAVKGRKLLDKVLANLDYAIKRLGGGEEKLVLYIKTPGSEGDTAYDVKNLDTDKVLAHFKDIQSTNVKLIVQPLANFTEEEKCNYLPCEQVFYTAIVKFDGRVSPCCIDIFDNLNIGDLRERSLPEILAGDRLHKIRLQHISGRVGEIPLCVHCGFRSAVDLTPFSRDIIDILDKRD